MEVSTQAKNKILALAVAFMLIASVLIGCGGPGSSSGNSETQVDELAELTFDTPFEFDDLTITFGSNFTTTTLDNQYSDHHGETVVAIPVTVTNNSQGTKGLSMFYFKAFDPTGAELSDISTYFMDDDIAWAGDARSGATLESTMHFLYNGPGDYYIEFDNYSENIEVKLPLNL